MNLHVWFLETNLGNALEKKRAGGDLIGLAAQRSGGHARVATAQRGPTSEGPRALAFCKRTPRLTGYYAAPLITIARETCFTLRTLEHVTFATGRSPAYLRTTAQHTGGNGGYAGRARAATIGKRADHHLRLNPQAWMAVGNLAAYCREWQR